MACDSLDLISLSLKWNGICNFLVIRNLCVASLQLLMYQSGCTWFCPGFMGMLSALQLWNGFHTVMETNWCRGCLNERACFIWLEPNTNYQVRTVSLILKRNVFCEWEQQRVKLGSHSAGVSSVTLLQRHSLGSHWCNRRKMLAPDFLFLIKQAETVKPLRNTSGFTNVCIFTCQCCNVKGAQKICDLCSWEHITGKACPCWKGLWDIKRWAR